MHVQMNVKFISYVSNFHHLFHFGKHAGQFTFVSKTLFEMAFMFMKTNT